MAVADLFLDGTVANNSTTTIQPASGTIYSFKRGSISGNSLGTTTQGFQIATKAGNITFQGWVNTTTQAQQAILQYLAFSEAGVYVNFYTGTANAITGPGGYATALPFVAISNGNTVGIVAGNSGTTTIYYTLVGVSMT